MSASTRTKFLVVFLLMFNALILINKWFSDPFVSEVGKHHNGLTSRQDVRDGRFISEPNEMTIPRAGRDNDTRHFTSSATGRDSGLEGKLGANGSAACSEEGNHGQKMRCGAEREANKGRWSWLWREEEKGDPSAQPAAQLEDTKASRETCAQLAAEFDFGGDRTDLPAQARKYWAENECDVLLTQATSEHVSIAVDESPKYVDEKDEECARMMTNLQIQPDASWGKATTKDQRNWKLLDCDNRLGYGPVRTPPQDCMLSPSKSTDPLIAVCAGSTTRGVEHPDEETLALFRYLLPSLGRTADCGFNYVAVIGYDGGDALFDSDDGRRKVMSWFQEHVSLPSASRGINIRLELIRVSNDISKPGPVFTATTQEAYRLGAKYIYRVNDDSEMLGPWARKFVNTLEALGPPYGVVGPESLNAKILVHDFTHRVHMDIFDRQYYPEVLTDWFVDDWISRVYGNERTIRASNCQVIHHVGAHGQRYKADRSKGTLLNNLLKEGAERIANWAEQNGFTDAAASIRSESLDGKSARQAAGKDIRRRRTRRWRWRWR